MPEPKISTAVLTALFVLLCALGAANAAPTDTPVSTDELKTFCKVGQYAQQAPMPTTPEQVLIIKGDVTCTAYVAALADIISLPTVAPLLRFCLPKEMTDDKLRVYIENLIRNAPKELLDYSAPFTVIAGLRMNFPCSKTPGQ